MNFPKLNISSVSEKIDFTQFLSINDPTGIVMYHIPYDYFHIWREQGKQEVYKELLKEAKKSYSEYCKFIEDKLEK